MKLKKQEIDLNSTFSDSKMIETIQFDLKITTQWHFEDHWAMVPFDQEKSAMVNGGDEVTWDLCIKY